MLTFTAEQMKAMRDETRRVFELRMLEHLRRAFPDRTAGAADARILEFIRYGIRRARRYGLVGQRDVRRYLGYMLIYGTHFDADPEIAWAGEILRRKGLGPSRRLDLIDAHTMFRRRPA